MIHSETKIHNWFTYIMFTNLSKPHTDRILRIMIKWMINLCQYIEINPLVIFFIWYQLLCFSTQIHIQVCWWIMNLHRWVALMIIQILLHVPKLWGEMLLLYFFCTFPMYHFPSNKYCYRNTYCRVIVGVILFIITSLQDRKGGYDPS